MNKNHVTTREQRKYWFGVENVLRFFSKKKWQNICRKIQNGILTRSTRTIDFTFDVTDVDERSIKKIYKKVKLCARHNTRRYRRSFSVLLFNPTAHEIELHRLNVSRFVPMYVPRHFTTRGLKAERCWTIDTGENRCLRNVRANWPLVGIENRRLKYANDARWKTWRSENFIRQSYSAKKLSIIIQNHKICILKYIKKKNHLSQEEIYNKTINNKSLSIRTFREPSDISDVLILKSAHSKILPPAALLALWILNRVCRDRDASGELSSISNGITPSRCVARFARNSPEKLNRNVPCVHIICSVRCIWHTRCAPRTRLRARLWQSRRGPGWHFRIFPGPRVVINYRFTATKIDSRAHTRAEFCADGRREFCLCQKLEIDVQFHARRRQLTPTRFPRMRFTYQRK